MKGTVSESEHPGPFMLDAARRRGTGKPCSDLVTLFPATGGHGRLGQTELRSDPVWQSICSSVSPEPAGTSRPPPALRRGPDMAPDFWLPHSQCHQLGLGVRGRAGNGALVGPGLAPLYCHVTGRPPQGFLQPPFFFLYPAAQAPLKPKTPRGTKTPINRNQMSQSRGLAGIVGKRAYEGASDAHRVARVRKVGGLCQASGGAGGCRGVGA